MKPILITGVGRRLGLATAKALLAEGWPIIGTYRTHYPELDELRSHGAVLYRIDLLDAQALTTFIAWLRHECKGLRAIVHNASDWLADDAGLPVTEVFSRMMGIHAEVPYQLNLALADLLDSDEIGGADIIHVTDYVAQKGSAKHIAYAASKAALENLTLSFAAKLAPTIKVNSIAPAMMLFNEQDDAAYREKTLAKALLPKAGGDAEFVYAVRYLLHSRYMTGSCLNLDGGRALK
ncbi:dihydromonapterin reductase [Shewanella yunxiaonensis]|uniref:Dihydromonapterin reductase n=1 Tax=Shewanella yunxiaonensis TaxID=2829809 RepID=A0ABX7YW47_9GAMM|nr:dihydromonapterin reductase [Shewanella yunxiaonensis]QUN06514.1 dihydromonapterin reductase [Shewanella yunxiaonensis]